MFMQEAEKEAEEERIRMENIVKGNPLMQAAPDKQADFKVKRRFDSVHPNSCDSL